MHTEFSEFEISFSVYIATTNSLVVQCMKQEPAFFHSIPSSNVAFRHMTYTFHCSAIGNLTAKFLGYRAGYSIVAVSYAKEILYKIIQSTSKQLSKRIGQRVH